MRKGFTTFLVLVLFTTLPGFADSTQRFQPRPPVTASALSPAPMHAASVTAFGFGTYASFNDSYTQCLGRDGSYYWSASFQTFDNATYVPCRSQMLSDIDFLGKHNIKSIRLWPVLSTFAYDTTTNTWGNLNSNINNLDEILAELAKYNMQAYITLMTTPDCSDPPETSNLLGYYFNPDLINNPTTQDQFMQSVQAFITHYSNNTAIYAYDLVNEMSFILANPPTKTSLGYCNLPYDSKGFSKTKAFLARLYSTVKSLDSLHQFTFSFTKAYPTGSNMVKTFSNVVDFYDIHAYSNDPVAFYANFSSYNKPVIHGEVGTLGVLLDRNGNDCQGTGSNYYENILPAMPPECQQLWLANAQAFVQQSQLHNIQALFFHLWTPSKSYGVRLYNRNNKLTGYQLTTAGQYIVSLAGSR